MIDEAGWAGLDLPAIAVGEFERALRAQVYLIAISRVLTSSSVDSGQRSTLARQHRAGPAPSNCKYRNTNTLSMSPRSTEVDV